MQSYTYWQSYEKDSSPKPNIFYRQQISLSVTGVDFKHNIRIWRSNVEFNLRSIYEISLRLCESIRGEEYTQNRAVHTTSTSRHSNMSVSEVHTTLSSYHHKKAKLMLLLLCVKFEIRLEYFAYVQFSFFGGK